MQSLKEDLSQVKELATTSSVEFTSLVQAYNQLESLNHQKDLQISNLKSQLNSSLPANGSQQNELVEEINKLKAKIQQKEREFESLEKEQEDLLMELANIETENNSLKAKLAVYEENSTIATEPTTM